MVSHLIFIGSLPNIRFEPKILIQIHPSAIAAAIWIFALKLETINPQKVDYNTHGIFDAAILWFFTRLSCLVV